MGIKKYTAYTPSRRNMTGSDFAEITKTTPEKSLLTSLKKNAGRNNQGKITVRHHGGGNRQKYRIVDFRRLKDGVPATVIGIEYDPNRSANIALICYADGEKSYIIAPQGLAVGQKVMNGASAEIRTGNCLPLSEIPVGTMIRNIDHNLINYGKAGRIRHMGIRPTVRGSVMNPNDHPHGGGEGKAPVGRPGPCTPWGKPALGHKTRRKKASDKLIVRRRNAGTVK